MTFWKNIKTIQLSIELSKKIYIYDIINMQKFKPTSLGLKILPKIRILW